MKKFILFASIIFVSNIICMDNNQMEITKDQIGLQQRKARDPILEKHKEIIQYHTELIEQINTLTSLSDEKDQRISDLERELAKNKAQIQQITEEKLQKDEQRELLQQQTKELNNQIQQLKSEKDQKDVEIEKMQRNHNTEIEIKNNEMQKLNIQIHELISEKNTQKQQIIQKDAEIKEIQCKYNELINSYEELKNYSNVLQQELNNINNILPSLQSTTQQSTMASSTRMSPVITKQ